MNVHMGKRATFLTAQYVSTQVIRITWLNTVKTTVRGRNLFPLQASSLSCTYFNPWKEKRRLLYLKTQSVPRSKHFSSRLYKPTILCLWGRSHCLFSDKYQAHKYGVGRAYSCWMLNQLVHHVTSRLQKVKLPIPGTPDPRQCVNYPIGHVSVIYKFRFQIGFGHGSTICSMSWYSDGHKL